MKPSTAEQGGWIGNGLGALAVLVAAHLALLAAFFAPAISTPDANGYMAQARLIALDGRTSIAVESPAQYVGSHWFEASPGLYYGQYPPGLPALLAPAFRGLGPELTLWVIPLMGTLSLVALFLVARAWVGPGWALFATALMALNPTANAHAMGADSHTAVCFFLTWGLVGLVQWDRTRSPWWAAAAGFCGGVIPTIRYPEVLFLGAFALFVLLAARRDGGWWRSRTAALIAGAAGAAVPLTALALRNQAAFGAFWKTGYSLSGEQTAFSLGYFVRYFAPYLALLLVQGLALLFPTGLAGLRELRRYPQTRRYALFLAAVIVPITLVYMAYYWSPNGHSMRFLLPTFFAYAIAAVWGLKLYAVREPRKARRAAIALIATTVAWGLPWSVVSLWNLKRDNAVLAEVTRAVERAVPPGGIVIADGGLQQHLDYVGAWRLASAEGAGTSPGREGPPGMRPDGPDIPPDPARAAAFRRDVRQWAGPNRPVYWVTSADAIAAFRQQAGGSDTFETIARVELGATARRPGPPGPGAGPGRIGPPPRLRVLGFALPFGPPGPPPGGGPGGPLDGPPGPGRGPGGAGGTGAPRPPRPDMFHPPEDGTLLIVRWTPSGTDA